MRARADYDAVARLLAEGLNDFGRACDTLGVRWRRMKPTAISVARRDDVALLDRFVGPKC